MLLIKNCAVPEKDGEEYKLREGVNITVDGQRIRSVGNALPGGEFDRVIDAGGFLAVPGLINAHTHSPENFLRGRFECAPLEVWLNDMYELPYPLGPEETYLACQMGAAEMLKGGTTALLDHLWFAGPPTMEVFDAAMRAYEEIGIRAAVAPLVGDYDSLGDVAGIVGRDIAETPCARMADAAAPAGDILALYEAFIEKWNRKGDGRLACFPGTVGIQGGSDELVEGCLELAEKYDTGMHTHALETVVQRYGFQKRYGVKSPLVYMEERGWLSPRVSLAHSIWYDDEDIAALARSGAVAVHNPAANGKLGSGRARIYKMLRAGVTVALGSDGAASSDNQSMFNIMKLAGLIHNRSFGDGDAWIRADEVVAMATTGGAAALIKRDRLGCLEEGYLADITLLNLNKVETAAVSDPFKHMTYCETGSSVDTVIVNGRVVLQGGRLLTIDESSLVRRIREIMGRRAEQKLPETWRIKHLDGYQKFLAGVYPQCDLQPGE